MTGQGSERWRVASLGGPSCGSSRPAVPRPDVKPSIQDPLTMLGIHDYWLFVATGVLLNLTPGQDTLYILGRSIAQGRRIGVASALGISAGAVVHTLAAALGLSAVLATSASAFIALKVGGAAYLVYLGDRMLMTRTAALGPMGVAGPVDTQTAFPQGLPPNILKPKLP